MAPEKLLIAEQALLQSLGVVEPVDPDNQRPEGSRRRHPVIGPVPERRVSRRDEAVDVDADRKDAGLHPLAEGLQPVVRQQFAVHARLRGHIVTEQVQPFAGLEADQVIVEHRLNEPPMVRQGHQQLAHRPGRVQEEADPVLHPETPQVPGHGDHVVVVNPEDIVRLDQGSQNLGEPGIGPLIPLAVGPFIGGQVDPVMEQRPQRPVGIAVVVFVDILGLQIDQGDGDPRAILHLQRAGEMFDRLAGPAEPQAVVFPQGRRQGHGQTAGRACGGVPGRGHAIGNDDQAAHRASVHERLSRTAQLMIPTRE